MEQVLKFYRIYFKVLFFVAPNFAAKQAFKLFCTPQTKKVRAQETVALAVAEEELLQLGKHSISLYKWGNGPKTALLVHGWEGNGGSLAGFKDNLIEQGYTVYSFDGPAHGKSTGKQTNVIEFSYTVARIIEQKEIKDLLVTHSFGSATTMFALAQNPHISIKRMALLTSPNKIEDVVTEYTTLMQFSPKNHLHLLGYIERFYNIKLQDVEVSKVAPKVNVEEFLIVHDEHDKIIPYAYSKNVAKALGSKANFITLSKAGHYRMLWNEAVLSYVTDFTAGVRV